MERDMYLRWSKGWTRNGVRTGPETEPAIDSKRNQEIYRNRARNGPGIVPVGDQKFEIRDGAPDMDLRWSQGWTRNGSGNVPEMEPEWT